MSYRLHNLPSLWAAAYLLEGEIIFILVTLRSMISMGRSNSSTMHRGMAPPQGCSAQARIANLSARPQAERKMH